MKISWFQKVLNFWTSKSGSGIGSGSAGVVEVLVPFTNAIVGNSLPKSRRDEIKREEFIIVMFSKNKSITY